MSTATETLGTATAPKEKSTFAQVMTPTVIVGALGYYVDLFDITLFGVVRVASLKSLGLTTPAQLMDAGVLLGNLQMGGMLLGGLLWGILGDKRGRLSVLFGSILLYSLANIANGFVTSIEMYGLLRFIAGVGLAGELGAAITLVSESLPPRLRGYGTTVVATCGLMGSVSAALLGQKLDWQHTYILGGCMGLVLLVARFSVFESGMFNRVSHSDVKRGDFFMLFKNGRGPKYLRCVFLGMPLWFTSGVIMNFSPEITASMGFKTAISAGNSILYYSIGLAAGDLASGMISQWMESRRRSLAAFLGAGALFLIAFSNSASLPLVLYYTICFFMGVAGGYWAVYVTTVAEQFGTNLRATVATTAPNFVRGSVVVMTLLFAALKSHIPVLQAALVVGVCAYALAFWSLVKLPETYGKDLEYNET